MVKAIEVESLVFRYHLTEVLHRISFSIESGEVIGLLGPNGAGKSTTLKILTGLLIPGEGRVCIKGLSLPEQTIDAKRIIGYVPESASLYESLTAQEYLELIGRLREIEERALQKKILPLLEIFEIAKQRFSRLATFSKGMRQKVLIAAALLHDPPVLLLDEPQRAGMFVSLPFERLKPFVRGVYLSLWMPVAILHLGLLAPCAWFWGLWPAMLFIGFCLALFSLYLATGILFIEGFPFATAFKPTTGNAMPMVLLIGLIPIFIFAVIQWIVFHNAFLVLAAAIILAASAYAVARFSLGKLEDKVCVHLTLLGLRPSQMFKQLE